MVDVKYTPPLQNDIECTFLQQNYLHCLKEKAVADDIPKRKCNNEQIVWFNLQCPDKWERFNDPKRLRSIFIKQKIFEKEPPKARFKAPVSKLIKLDD